GDRAHGIESLANQVVRGRTRSEQTARYVNLRSGEVEPIEVHHFAPGRDEVVNELLLGVGAAIDFSQRSKLRVRTEDQVDARAGAPQFARFAIADFELVEVFGNRRALAGHVEQIDEEVVG